MCTSGRGQQQTQVTYHQPRQQFVPQQSYATPQQPAPPGATPTSPQAQQQAQQAQQVSY